jgi:retron-type reverse transcriptase
VLEVPFEDIVGTENLLGAWSEFLAGKRKKPDVQKFKEHLIENVRELHVDLVEHRYVHGKYYHFRITDPKPRDIHKASVRDRLLHHALYRVLYPFFDPLFIADSFSCRMGKGTHAAMKRFHIFARSVSRNHTQTCWVLKMDVRKFFANIDHDVLLSLLYRRVHCLQIMWLFEQVISSFPAGGVEKGLPLGNLTSQLFANVYMDELDQFVKHRLHAKQYIRYADDFVILSTDRQWLTEQLPKIEDFLWQRLRLNIHPKKIELKTIASGVDFLGWVHFPDHRVLRTVTKKRMKRRVAEKPEESTLRAYTGLLRHGNAEKLTDEVENMYWMFGKKQENAE